MINWLISRIEVPRNCTGVGILLKRRRSSGIVGILRKFLHGALRRYRQVRKRFKVTSIKSVRLCHRFSSLTFPVCSVQNRTQGYIRICYSTMSTVRPNRVKVKPLLESRTTLCYLNSTTAIPGTWRVENTVVAKRKYQGLYAEVA